MKYVEKNQMNISGCFKYYAERSKKKTNDNEHLWLAAEK